MSDNIKLDNPMANEILVYSDIEEKFVNVRADMNTLGITLPTYSVVKLSQQGESLVSRFQSNTLRTKTIVAGDGLSLTTNSSSVTISLDASADAQTLQGKTPSDFLLVENALSEIDISDLMETLDAYSRPQADDLFMETNGSNIPDKDIEYDLGANGRRYADVYAQTFHGLATEAMIAHNVAHNGANDNDLLVWRDTTRRWMPEPVLDNYLSTKGLQILPVHGEHVNRPTDATFNVEDGNVQHHVFTASQEIALHAPADGNLYSLTLILHDADDFSITWPSYVSWIGGNEPTFTQKDIFTAFTIDGVNWVLAYVGSY